MPVICPYCSITYIVHNPKEPVIPARITMQSSHISVREAGSQKD